MPDLVGIHKTGLVIGSIIPIAQDAEVPFGTLLCDGASLLRVDYEGLYDSIGTRWGAADGTHFNLPDLRGRVPRGRDRATARDPHAATRGSGVSPNGTSVTGQATGDNVGSIQDDAIQGHWHEQRSADTAQLATGSVNFSRQDGASATGFESRVAEAITDGVNGTPRVSQEARMKNAYVDWVIVYL